MEKDQCSSNREQGSRALSYRDGDRWAQSMDASRRGPSRYTRGREPTKREKDQSPAVE